MWPDHQHHHYHQQHTSVYSKRSRTHNKTGRGKLRRHGGDSITNMPRASSKTRITPLQEARAGLQHIRASNIRENNRLTYPLASANPSSQKQPSPKTSLRTPITMRWVTSGTVESTPPDTTAVEPCHGAPMSNSSNSSSQDLLQDEKDKLPGRDSPGMRMTSSYVRPWQPVAFLKMVSAEKPSGPSSLTIVASSRESSVRDRSIRLSCSTWYFPISYYLCITVLRFLIKHKSMQRMGRVWMGRTGCT